MTKNRTQPAETPNHHQVHSSREIRRALARADGSGRVRAPKASSHWLQAVKKDNKEKAFLKDFKTERLGQMLTEKGDHRLGAKFLKLAAVYPNVWDLANLPASINEIDKSVRGVSRDGLKQVAEYLIKFNVKVRWA